MADLYGISSYQQAGQTWKSGKSQQTAKSGQTTAKSDVMSGKVEVKKWTSIDTGSSLVPKTTEYGNTIGEVQLSDKAKDYYSSLKGKFQNMEFIVVSSDMKAQVQQNAASYGNANKMVVLIDEEKLERMATDESYRKKYEGLIAMAQNKLTEAKNGFTSSGAGVKNFGMSIDSNGKESYFATLDKSQELQKKRIEKKAEEKKEQKVKERKAAEKEAKEERIEKAKEKNAEQVEEYLTFESDSFENLLAKVQTYSYDMAAMHVRTEAELARGGNIDFKG